MLWSFRSFHTESQLGDLNGLCQRATASAKEAKLPVAWGVVSITFLLRKAETGGAPLPGALFVLLTAAERQG